MTASVFMVEPSGRGGVCQQTFALCAALQRLGEQPFLCTDREFEFAGVRSTFATSRRLYTHRWDRERPSLQRWHLQRPQRLLRYLRNVGVMVSDMRKTQAHLVHFQFPLDAQWDGRLFRTLRRLGMKLIYSAHEILPLEQRPRHLGDYRRLYQACDQIVVLSDFQRQRMAQDFPNLVERMVVQPLGNLLFIRDLAREWWGQDNLTRKWAREQLGLPLYAPLLLFFGYIQPHKGLSVLLRATAKLRHRLPQSRLLIAGLPRGGFRPFREEIVHLGLAESVSCYLAFHPYWEVALYLAATDVVALPYLEASQSAVLQLAGAFARPAVASRVGGIPEGMIEGETGLLVPPGDESALADALLDLLSSPRRAEQMGQAAQAFVSERFRWDDIARSMKRLYLPHR